MGAGVKMWRWLRIWLGLCCCCCARFFFFLRRRVGVTNKTVFFIFLKSDDDGSRALRGSSQATVSVDPSVPHSHATSVRLVGILPQPHSPSSNIDSRPRDNYLLVHNLALRWLLGKNNVKPRGRLVLETLPLISHCCLAASSSPMPTLLLFFG